MSVTLRNTEGARVRLTVTTQKRVTDPWVFSPKSETLRTQVKQRDDE